MTSYEGSFLTSEIEEIPNTPMSESSATRDSVATYTTDLDDSSMVSMETDSNYVKAQRVSSQRKSTAQENVSPFYHRKRFWAMCAAISIVISAIFIPLLFLVIIPNIAQSSVNKSNIDFDAINITNPRNDSFLVSMSGKTSGTGPFSATITFNGPVTILYKDNILGSIVMDPISVAGGKGNLVGSTRNFTIVDKGLFLKFASEVMVIKEFEWVLRGSASVKTLGININGLKLNKVLKIPGSNGFVTNLLSLKANENPDKTLSLEVITSIFNPSPIGIELGDMTVQLNSDTTILTIVTAKNVFLGAKQNNITMTGNTFLPKTEQDRLNAIKVMNGYLSNTQVNTTANVLSVLPKSGPVDWLSTVVQNLTLVTSVGSSPPAQKIISNLDFGQIKMTFTPDDPYSPTISSSNAIADYALPFNINFKILNVGQKLTLATNDYKDIASIESPQVPVNSTDKEISLNIPETKMKILDAGKFSDLFASLTTGKEANVVIYGKSDIDTQTDSLGFVPIRGLPFNLTTSFQGFQQFNSDGKSPSVSNLNILEGTSSQLYIGVVVVLTNPTQYSISVGKITLDIFFKEKKIGTAVIPDFSIGPGPNSVEVLTILDDPANNDVGKELLDSFLTGKEITVNIKGSNNSTSITSLIPAFKAIDIPTVFPPSQTPFLKSAKILIDDQTPTTNISTGIAELSNPYDTPISIYNMNSSYSYNGQTIGTVVQDFGSSPLFIPGNSVQNLTLPVKMVIDPVLSFTILRDSAIRNNLDVTVLDSLIAFSNLTVPGANPNPNPTPQAISSFNLATFVTTALANIPITVNLEAQVAIGFYIMKMTYKQVVISTTDESVLKLIPALAQPLVQNTMQQSQMTFDSIFMQNIDVASFDILASGQVTNTGPLPAQVSFPNGMTVSSNNIVLGTVTLPPIIADPSGTKFNNVSRFNIADVNTFASFSQNAFTADTISWDIAADNVIITAFGLPIGPISLRKTIQISGFSGLKQYQLQHFTLPLSITIGLNNPSVVGVELGTVVYDLVVTDQKIATITGNNISITPHAVSSLTFTGDLNLATIDPNLAQSFFSKSPPTLIAKGVSVTPPKATGEVVWLLASFKSLSLTVPFSVALLLPNGAPGLPAPAAPAAPIPS